MKDVNYKAGDINRAAATLYGAWQNLLQKNNSNAHYLQRLMTTKPPTTYLKNAATSAFIPLTTVTEQPKISNSSISVKHKLDLQHTNDNGVSPSKKIKSDLQTTSQTIIISDDSSDEVQHTEVSQTSDAEYVVIDSDEELKRIVYQCDFCDFQNADASKTEEHVSSECHISFSKYQVRTTEMGKSILVLLNHQVYRILGMDYALPVMIFCPTCYLPLPNKFLCGHHHQLHHDVQPRYSVGSLVLVELVDVPCVSECVKCQESFGSRSKLHAHWTQHDWKCAPFPPMLSLPGKLVALLSCTGCSIKTYRLLSSKSSYHSVLLSFANHMIQSSYSCNSVTKQMRIQIFDLSQPTGSPPFQLLSPMEHSDSLGTELLEDCKRLRTYYKSFFTLSKSYLHRIQQEIETLQSILKTN